MSIKHNLIFSDYHKIKDIYVNSKRLIDL